MRVLVVLLALFVLLAPSASAQSRWSIEVYTGTSFKAPTTLHIAQEGHPDVTIGDVRYETRPWSAFESLALLTTNYYSVRVGYVIDDARDDVRFGVEVEFLHDKAYYLSGDDPEGVVQHFELSDGANYLLLNGAPRFRSPPTTRIPPAEVSSSPAPASDRSSPRPPPPSAAKSTAATCKEDCTATTSPAPASRPVSRLAGWSSRG